MSPLADAIAAAAQLAHDDADHAVERAGETTQADGPQMGTAVDPGACEPSASTDDGHLRREVGREEAMPDGSHTAGLSTSQREQLHALLASVDAHHRELDALRLAITCELDGIPGSGPLDVQAIAADVAALSPPPALLIGAGDEPSPEDYASAVALGAFDLDDDEPACPGCGGPNKNYSEPCEHCESPEQRFINTRASANEDY